MKLPHLLAIAALILWVGSVWPGEFRSGKTWILLDRSPSMGAEPDLESWLEQTDLSLEAWQKAVKQGRLISFPTTETSGSPDLSHALSALREDLSPPDRVVIRTDGRALNPLPNPKDWSGIQVDVIPPHPQPRFHQVLTPGSWPLEADLWMRIHMLDADLAKGNLDVRDLSQQVTSLEILNQGDSWFALRLHCDAPPKVPLQLHLRWQEEAGRANTSVRILPSGQAPVASLALDSNAEELRRRLQNGEVLLLASPEFVGWQKLPPDLQIFAPQETPDETPLWVLLDTSGSMEGESLKRCRDALIDLREQWSSGPIWVLPFQQDLLNAIALQEAAGLEQLQKLQAFGPTNLRKALTSLAPRFVGEQALLILSDGAAGDAETDWPQFLAQSFPDTRIFCLPTGTKAQGEFLAGLGTLVVEGEFQERLAQVLSELTAAEILAVQAAPQASFPLPDTWMPSEKHPKWQAAPGVEVLLQDVHENLYLAGRRVGPGLLLGLADEANEGNSKLINAIALHFQSPGRSGWVGERFLVQSKGETPQISQDGVSLEVRMLDPDLPVLWEAVEASPRMPVSVQFENGTHWAASALTTPEFGNSVKPWLTWQENQRNGLTGPKFRPRLLLAGLLLMTMAFALRKLSQR